MSCQLMPELNDCTVDVLPLLVLGKAPLDWTDKIHAKCKKKDHLDHLVPADEDDLVKMYTPN